MTTEPAVVLDWAETPQDSGAPELLARLVALAAGSYDVAEIQAVNELLTQWYERCGFQVRRLPVEGRGDLLLAERRTGRPGSPEGRRVTIVGHSDTVWPIGSVRDPRLSVVASGTRWAGPGIGDMKAALLLAAEAAVIAAAQLLDAPAGLVRILVVPDEEVGSVGSAAEIARVAAQTDLCIGLEAGKPTGAFVTSRGAVGAMRLDVEGVAAHVTEPGGVNAVETLVDVLTRVRGLALGGAQISITQLGGGTARQISAAKASAWIDLRANTATEMSAAVEAITSAARAVQRNSDAIVGITGGQTRPAFPLEASGLPWAFLEGFDRLEARPWPPTAVHERGGSDASTFAAAGVPTIDGFGPICFDNCGPDESISVASLAPRRSLMAALIAEWSRHGARLRERSRG